MLWVLICREREDTYDKQRCYHVLSPLKIMLIISYNSGNMFANT